MSGLKCSTLFLLSYIHGMMAFTIGDIKTSFLMRTKRRQRTSPRKVHDEKRNEIANKLLQNNTVTSKVIQHMPKYDAIQLINERLYPQNEYRNREKISSTIYNRNSVLSASDPQLSFTYAEFELQSMDELLDLATKEYQRYHNERHPKILIDLGSGCGRLLLYSSLCCQEQQEGNGDWSAVSSPTWKEVHGIEINKELHLYAISVLEQAIQDGYIDSENNHKSSTETETLIHLHYGPASDFKHVLSKADIIFCYSTAFDSDGFDTEIGAMVLADEWSQLLADACKPGCVVVTTDRALKPSHGWELKHFLDVYNKIFLDSRGYISILNK